MEFEYKSPSQVDVDNNSLGEQYKAIESHVGDIAKHSNEYGMSFIGSMMDGKESHILNIIGDSTGNNNTEWVYLLTQKIASKFNNYNIKYALIDQSTGLYPSPTPIKIVGPERYIEYTNSGAVRYLPYKIVKPRESADLDIRIRLKHGDWDNGTQEFLINRYASSGHRCYRLSKTSTNRVFFEWSNDGTTNNSIDPVATIGTFDNEVITWLRCTFDVDNGAGGRTFTVFKSTEQVSESKDITTWIQIGTKTDVGVTSIFEDSTVDFTLGMKSNSEAMLANFYKVEVYDGIDGVLITPPNIDAWQSLSATTAQQITRGTPELYIFNSSIPGSSIETYNTTLLRKAVVNGYYQNVFISLSHNQLWTTGDKFLTPLDAMIEIIKTLSYKPKIALLTQNPKGESTQPIPQGIRRSEIIKYALEKGYKYIDTYFKFVDKINNGVDFYDLINVDDIHPTEKGSEECYLDEVWNFLTNGVV